MPGEELSKETIEALIEAIEERAKHDEAVSTSLKSLVESLGTIKADIALMKSTTSPVVSIATDIHDVKSIVKTAALVTIIVSTFLTVVLRGLDNRGIFKDNIKKMISEVLQEERLHDSTRKTSYE